METLSIFSRQFDSSHPHGSLPCVDNSYLIGLCQSSPSLGQNQHNLPVGMCRSFPLLLTFDIKAINLL
jgi:hypothetical protein